MFRILGDILTTTSMDLMLEKLPDTVTLNGMEMDLARNASPTTVSYCSRSDVLPVRARITLNEVLDVLSDGVHNCVAALKVDITLDYRGKEYLDTLYMVEVHPDNFKIFQKTVDDDLGERFNKLLAKAVIEHRKEKNNEDGE